MWHDVYGGCAVVVGQVMFFHGDFPLVADMLYYANISRRKIR